MGVKTCVHMGPTLLFAWGSGILDKIYTGTLAVSTRYLSIVWAPQEAGQFLAAIYLTQGMQ